VGYVSDANERMFADVPPDPGAGRVEPSLAITVGTVPADLPKHLADRLAEAPDGDRSKQTAGLVAAAVEWGYDDGRVIALALEHRPTKEKYGKRADREAKRVLDKIRPDHQHVGQPCDRAGCRNKPQWMTGEREEGDQPRRRAASASEPPTLGDLLEAMALYLFLDDPDHVRFALAVAVSAELDGPPLWGQLVGAPSGGKTEAIEILRDQAAHLDELTAAGLLTWQPGKGKGTAPKPAGALVRLGQRGLLTIGDMSTVIAGSDRSGSAREQLFANLRRIYDGSLNRDIGAPPGASGPLQWRGRATILAACTPAIDRYTAHGDALGPRWIYFRLAQADAKGERERQQKVLDVDQLEELQAKARHIAGALVDAAARRVRDVALTKPMAEAIFDVAQVACWGRAAVPRHGYGRREIDGLPVIESTPRITRQLLTLARCLLALEVDQTKTLALTRRAGLDSMPEIRRRTLAELLGPDVLTESDLARRLECDRGVARRTLEDLAAIGLVEWPEGDEDEDPRFRLPRLWPLRDGERLPLIRRAFCLVAPCAETDFYPPPLPPRDKAVSTSAQDKTDTPGDAPPPLTDADDLFDGTGYDDPGGWSR
jgi:hypothetical protein